METSGCVSIAADGEGGTLTPEGHRSGSWGAVRAFRAERRAPRAQARHVTGRGRSTPTRGVRPRRLLEALPERPGRGLDVPPDVGDVIAGHPPDLDASGTRAPPSPDSD